MEALKGMRVIWRVSHSLTFNEISWTKTERGVKKILEREGVRVEGGRTLSPNFHLKA